MIPFMIIATTITSIWFAVCVGGTILTEPRSQWNRKWNRLAARAIAAAASLCAISAGLIVAQTVGWIA